MKYIYKITTILIFFLMCNIPLYSQMSRQEVLSILSLEDYSQVQDPEMQLDNIYNRYLDQISYKVPDLLEGIGFSVLSGISLGAYESNNIGYKYSGWLPKPLRDWYNNSLRQGNWAPDYRLFSWQMVWREIDYASDRSAYESLKLFFRGKWYWALLAHWIIKNTFATIVRDRFKHDEFFYSFEFSLF